MGPDLHPPIASPLALIRARRREVLIQGLRAALRDHPPGPGVQVVRLFGSWARGDFDGLSDIDLLVLTDGDAGLFDSAHLPDAARLDIAQVPAALHARLAAEGHPFHGRVAADAVELWCRPAPAGPSSLTPSPA